MKKNIQSLFLSRSVRRGNSRENSKLSKSRSFFSGKLGVSKYKGLKYMLGGNSNERKPVFRITSLAQNLYSSSKSTKENKEEEKIDKKKVIRRNHFSYQMVIGKGGFGKVWIVEQKTTKKYYALKEMSKAKVISKRSVHSVMNEKKLLAKYEHNFIVNMKFAFQDRDYLYLVMDLLTGGDLRFHICFFRRFKEEQTKFFAACIILGLEYIHNHGILHRDIKPENLVFEENGYLRITDFGIARKWSPDNAKETSGTPGYMAPEVMCRQNHGIEVDYFALGVICFECMKGRRPYLGRSRKEIRDQILAKQVKLRREDISRGWSVESADFINGLIQRKPSKRLGTNGPSELKNHPWFKDFPWEKLEKKELKPPFKPNTKHVFDYAKHLSEEDTDPSVHAKGAQYLRRQSVQDLFNNYYYQDKKVKTKKVKRKSSKLLRRKNLKVKSLNSSLYKFVEKNRSRKRRLGLDSFKF